LPSNTADDANQIKTLDEELLPNSMDVVQPK